MPQGMAFLFFWKRGLLIFWSKLFNFQSCEIRPYIFPNFSGIDRYKGCCSIYKLKIKIIYHKKRFQIKTSEPITNLSMLSVIILNLFSYYWKSIFLLHFLYFGKNYLLLHFEIIKYLPFLIQRTGQHTYLDVIYSSGMKLLLSSSDKSIIFLFSKNKG